MGNDLDRQKQGVSRQGASTRARDCRASALRHTRAPGEAPSYLLACLINNKLLLILLPVLPKPLPTNCFKLRTSVKLLHIKIGS
jgi:hypothetical protein